MNRDRSQSTEESGFRAWTAATGDRFATADERRVEVFLRSMLPPLGVKASQERLLGRFDELEGGPRLDDVSVTVTGDRLCLCDTCTGTDAGSELVERVRELAEWGDNHGASASPFFDRRTIDSNVANETARALVPPRVSVALYCDERLSGVFPCRIGARCYAVDDFVDALEQFAGGQRVAVER